MHLEQKLRMGGPVVLGEVGPHLLLVAAADPRDLVRYSTWPAAATYIGLFDNDTVVVGATGGLQQRMRNQNWRNLGLPKAVIAFVTRPGAPLWTREDALALERIVAHALSVRLHVDTDLGLPHGYPRGIHRYAKIQAAWSSSLPILREVAPKLACAWPGAPSLCESEVPECGDLLELRIPGVHAQVMRVENGRYVVLAGSTIRRRCTPSAKTSIEVGREELGYSGALLPIDEEAWLLTRDVEVASLTECTDFVYTYRGPHAKWRRLRRQRTPEI